MANHLLQASSVRKKQTGAIGSDCRARFSYARSLFVATLGISATTASLVLGQPPKPSPLVPGVRIDWTAGAVEIDAKIALRSGPLELIACSPQTREHESILVTKALPIHVFQAMGLVGLVEGSPVTYDKTAKKWHPPTGERLRISVKCENQPAYVPIRTWVVDPKTKASPGSINWVFAGSSTLPDGRFLANLDGTIICLVDFESALITVGALHSADNTSLWLEAKTDAIPPVGTSCTIRIEPQAPRIVVQLRATGELTHDNRLISITTLAKKLQDPPNSSPVLVILCEHDLPRAKADSLKIELVAAGVNPSLLSIRFLAKPSK